MTTLEKKVDHKQALSDEQKAKRKRIEAYKEKYRDVQLEYAGRLYIDPKYKKEGKTLRIDNDDAATRNQLESLGYTIVQDDSMKKGSGSLSEPSSLGSTVQFEQAIFGTSQPGVLYEIDSEVLEARQELDAENNNARLENEITEGQYEGMMESIKNARKRS